MTLLDIITVTVTAEEQVLALEESVWKGEEELQRLAPGFPAKLSCLKFLGVQVQTVVPLWAYPGHTAFIHRRSFLCPTWVLGSQFPRVESLNCFGSPLCWTLSTVAPSHSFPPGHWCPIWPCWSQTNVFWCPRMKKLAMGMLKNWQEPEWIWYEGGSGYSGCIR